MFYKLPSTGVVGLEPTITAVKVLCLTFRPYPNICLFETVEGLAKLTYAKATDVDERAAKVIGYIYYHLDKTDKLLALKVYSKMVGEEVKEVVNFILEYIFSQSFNYLK